MGIFNVGPLELLFILLIMLIVLGPQDMVKTGRRLGKMIHSLVRSQTWISMMNASRELRDLPTKLVRESGLEEEIAQARDQAQLLNLNLNFLGELKNAENTPPALQTWDNGNLPVLTDARQAGAPPGAAPETLPADPSSIKAEHLPGHPQE